MLLGQGNCDAGGQRNTLVGGTQQQIELQPGVDNGVGVTAPEDGQCRTAAKSTSVEKIRARSTGFQGKFTEFKRINRPRQLNK